MKIIKASGVLLSAFALAACRVEIPMSEGGLVISDSGKYKISADSGKKHISISVSDTKFHQTFYAIPEPDYEFSHWKNSDQSFCGATSAPCRLSTVSFSGNDALMAALASHDTYKLEAVFKEETREVNEVSGVLHNDVTWSGRVKLIGTVEIGPNATLFIEPGTHVYQDDDTYHAITSYGGNIVAVGSESKPIIIDDIHFNHASSYSGQQDVPGSERVVLQNVVVNMANAFEVKARDYGSIEIRDSSFLVIDGRRNFGVGGGYQAKVNVENSNFYGLANAFVGSREEGEVLFAGNRIEHSRMTLRNSVSEGNTFRHGYLHLISANTFTKNLVSGNASFVGNVEYGEPNSIKDNSLLIAPNEWSVTHHDDLSDNYWGENGSQQAEKIITDCGDTLQASYCTNYLPVLENGHPGAPEF